MDFVARVIPKMTPEQRLRAVKRALEHAASLGVTSVQDMSADLRRHRRLRRSGEPRRADRRASTRRRRKPAGTIRPSSASIARSDRRGCASAPSRYADGRWIDDRVLLQPYVDAPARAACSRRMQDSRRCARLMARSRACSCAHAIGDAASRRSSICSTTSSRANGERDRRFRIEHAQHIAPKDFDRFASLNVIASVSRTARRRRSIGGRTTHTRR